MSFKSNMLAGVAAATFAATYAGTALAESARIMVMDPYFRSATMRSPTGAAFMTLVNTGDQDDRLIAASSDIAKRVETHTHIEGADGVMMMREVEDGFAIPANGSHVLRRGGDHLMFLGLSAHPAQGEMVRVTLRFERAGDMTIEIPVDLTRKPEAGGMKMNMPASGTDG